MRSSGRSRASRRSSSSGSPKRMNRPPLQEPRARGETSIARILPALASLPAQRRGVAVPPRSVHPAGDRARRRRRRRDRDLLRLGHRRDPDRRTHGQGDRGARRALGPGHRRAAQRHLRQRARDHHRPLRPGQGPAGGGQGLAVGSILGNTLLVLGAAAFVGGLGRDRQTFNRTAATRAVGDAAAGRRRAGDAGGLRDGRRARAARARRECTSTTTPRSSTSRWRWRSSSCSPTSPG